MKLNLRERAADLLLLASQKFASAAFKVSGETPLRTATGKAKPEPEGSGEGHIMPTVALSDESVRMRADLTPPLRARPQEPEKPAPLKGSLEERAARVRKW